MVGKIGSARTEKEFINSFIGTSKVPASLL